MADGALSIELSDLTVAKLSARAKALGITPEVLASLVLDQQFFDHDDLAWPGGDPRDDHASNYDLNETGRTWRDVRPELVERLERKLSERE